MQNNSNLIFWDEEKNTKLRKERGVCFEEVVERIVRNEVLDVLEHRTRKNQMIFVVVLNARIHAVPFIRDEGGNIFLKTIYPSRRLQKFYGRTQNQTKA
jgi:uncharacterized DUF497 family protein